MVALESAIYGLAVGDALGVPFESKRRGSFVCDDMIGFGVWNKEPGTWSDDTSMTLATCKSIKDQSGIDPKDIRKKFEEWLYKAKFTSNNEVFDVGNTTREAIELGFGIDDFYANGNGSLMRILPLAFTDATDNEIKEISAITHAHKLSKDVCVTYVHIARKMMNGKKFQDRRLQNKKENEIKSSGYVLHTLEASLWCILNSSSYKEAVLKAVNLGGDTDTTASVTGGLAGIIYGYEAIPQRWIKLLKNKELIEECLF